MIAPVALTDACANYSRHKRFRVNGEIRRRFCEDLQHNELQGQQFVTSGRKAGDPYGYLT
jgi:hypothetical protein